jgi:hypothetical protein
MFPVSGQRKREINLDWEREKIQQYPSDFIPPVGKQWNGGRWRTRSDETVPVSLRVAGERRSCSPPARRQRTTRLEPTCARRRRTTRREARLAAEDALKRYYKVKEYEYRVKTVVLGTLKRCSIISLTLYLEWYSGYSILYSSGPH